MSNQPVPYQTIGSDPQAALQFIDTMGDAFAKGGLVGCKTPGQGKMLALTCLCDGITPLELVRTYHLVDGKPTMRSDAMLAKFRQSGGKVKWKNLGDDGKEARAVFSFDGESQEITYSIDDAKRAGLVRDKSNWERDPGSMLRARLSSKAVRIMAPEIVAGVYTPEEMGDEPLESNNKPKARKQPKDEPIDTTAEVVEETTPENPFGGVPPKEEDVADVPFDEGPATFDSGKIASNELKLELKTLVGSHPALREFGQDALKQMGVGAVSGLTQLQGMHLAILLYVELLNFEEKLSKALEKFSVSSVFELSEDAAEKFLTSIRKQAKAAGK